MKLKLMIRLLVLAGLLSGFAPVAQAFYNPSAGHWLNRDPIQENDGPNIYAFVGNNPVNKTDMLGLWATRVHEAIIDRWLSEEKWGEYPWRCCCKLDVRAALKSGSIEVDGGGDPISFFMAQSSGNAYQHAMRSPGESVASAQAKYNQFLSDNISKARQLAAQARTGNCGSMSRKGGATFACAKMLEALRTLGHAYHAYSDSLSPAHTGFQEWYGPIDASIGPLFVFGNWIQFQDHEPKETFEVYNANDKPINNAVKGQFQGVLDELLKY